MGESRQERRANRGGVAGVGHRAWARVIAVVAVAGLCASGSVGPRCLAGEPADEDERFVVIRAGRVITNVGDEVRNGVIVVSGGTIRSVGKGLEYPLSATVIDARDRVVMPGLINPHSRNGLPRYGRGGVHGDLTVAEEYFPLADAHEDLLKAGYTAVALVPAGQGIPGRAMIVRTGGDEDGRTLQSPAYLRVTADKRLLRGALARAKKEIEKVETARKEFEKKREETRKEREKKAKEAKGKKPEKEKEGEKPAATQPAKEPAFKPPPIDPAHKVLVDLIQKKPGVFALVELGNASDYEHMQEVLAKHEIAHHFLARNHRQSDLEYVVEKLGRDEAKIILQPEMGRVPYSAERLHLVRVFSEAGCEVSLMPVGDRASEYAQMFGRLAELVRAGWSREAALKSVTLHPARLLGLDKRLGSIEQGKDADFVFLDGDPLDPTVRVQAVMIGGQIVHEAEGDE